MEGYREKRGEEDKLQKQTRYVCPVLSSIGTFALDM